MASTFKDGTRRIFTNFLGHDVAERFVVLGRPRTGSNYLLAGLNSSKIITTYGEIFADHSRTIGEEFDKTLSRLYRKERRGTSAVGFKLFYNHLTNDEWEKFLVLKQFKVIHLTRANRLRAIVSLDVAFKTGEWGRTSPAVRQRSNDKRITMDTTKLLKRLEAVEAQEKKARERFRHWPLVEVVYEEMVTNPRHIFQSLGNFLEVDDVDFTKIKYHKQNSQRLEQQIVNYDEVRMLLENSKFSSYLRS